MKSSLVCGLYGFFKLKEPFMSKKFEEMGLYFLQKDFSSLFRTNLDEVRELGQNVMAYLNESEISEARI